jgi:hypothetical protein
MNIKHPEAFTIILVKMLMMHFVRPSDRPDVSIAGLYKPFEALVDDDIVNYEIGCAVCHDPVSDSLKPKDIPKSTNINQGDTGYRKYYKEPVVFFKKT